MHHQGDRPLSFLETTNPSPTERRGARRPPSLSSPRTSLQFLALSPSLPRPPKPQDLSISLPCSGPDRLPHDLRVFPSRDHSPTFFDHTGNTKTHPGEYFSQRGLPGYKRNLRLSILPGTKLSPIPLRYRGFSGRVLKRREEIPPSSLFVWQVLRFLEGAMLFSLQGGQGLQVFLHPPPFFSLGALGVPFLFLPSGRESQGTL